MFFCTSTADAPRLVIETDDERGARIESIRTVLRTFPYPGRREEPLWVDPRIVRTVEAEAGSEDRDVPRARSVARSPRASLPLVLAPEPAGSTGRVD